MILVTLLCGLTALFVRVDTFPLMDCSKRDIDIKFFLDCQHSLGKREEKMENILKNFVSGSINSSERDFRVTLVNLHDRKIMSSYPGEQYPKAFSNVCSYKQYEINNTLVTYNHTINIYIIQCIWYEPYARMGYFIDGAFIILISNELCSNKNLRNIYHVTGDDDLQLNHGLSARLCNQCADEFVPLRNKNNEITSCYYLRQHRKYRSWQFGSNYCKNKIKGHLITLENASDFHILQQNIIKISSKSDMKICIGLYKVNVRNFGRLQWINQRPVVSSVYKEVRLPTINYASNKVCFFLQTYHNNVTSIEYGSCTKKTATHSLCETEISRYEIQLPFTSPNSGLSSAVHAMDKSSGNLISISNSVHLNSKDYRNDKVFPSFACNHGDQHISYHFVCDGVNDCPSGEDEKICAFDSTECRKATKFVCSTPGEHSANCVAMDARCNLIPDCEDRSDEWNCDECMDRDCGNNLCIPSLWYFNCSLNIPNFTGDSSKRRNVYGENDIYLEVNNSQDFFTHCDTRKQNLDEEENLPAGVNNSNTVMWIPKCLYIRGQFGSILGCEDMSHLYDCEDFRCPVGFAKCSNAYCVPIYLVNDGIKDCPHGEDEDKDDLLEQNSNYFVCYESNIRIHVLQVCDGQQQCPRGDDELNCNVQCPLGFLCLDETVTVRDTSTVLNFYLIPPNATYLNISGADVSLAKAINDNTPFIKLLVFIAAHCNVTDEINFKFKTNDVYLLDLSYNKLTTLNHSNLLSDFQKVYILNMSHNSYLHFIDEKYFHNFKFLQSLDLSFTKITQLNVYLNFKLIHLELQATKIINLNLSQFSKFELIDLRNSHFTRSISQNFFFNISVTGKILADPSVCCPFFRGPNIPDTKCVSDKILLSTCNDLIGDHLKRYLLWIVASCSVIGNLTVIGYRIFFERATLKLTYGSLVTCLSISDLLMGVYLVIIAAIDVRYRDAYIGHSIFWKQSSLCQVAGALTTWSSQTSTYFILLITLERYLTIKYPFGQHRFSSLTKNLCILLSWLLGFLLAFIPLLYPELSSYSTSGMCLGFPLRKFTGQAWIYSVVIFLFINSFLFVLVACGQAVIFYLIKTNSTKFKSGTQQSVRRADDIRVAKKLALVVVSNFICWFPVCILGLRTVFSDYEVDMHTYAWIVTLVLPVNAAINPFLYTVPSIYRGWQDFKHGSRNLPETTAITISRRSTAKSDSTPNDSFRGGSNDAVGTGP